MWNILVQCVGKVLASYSLNVCKMWQPAVTITGNTVTLLNCTVGNQLATL